MPLAPYTEPRLLDQFLGNCVGQVNQNITAPAAATTAITVRGSVGSGNMDITAASGQVFLLVTPGSGATQNQYSNADIVTATAGSTGTSLALTSQTLGKSRAVGDYIFLVGTTSAFNTFVFLNTIYVGLSTAGAQTTIAAGSDGATLPQGTITVASTTGFTSTGNIIINTSSGPQNVAYTGTTGTTFTGGTGGTGTMKTTDAVYQAPTQAQLLAAEPTSTGSYARVVTVNNAANFSAATGSLPASKTNAATITFAASTAAWSTGATALVTFFFADISTLAGGNILAWGYLTTPQTVNAASITPSFAASSLTATLL